VNSRVDTYTSIPLSRGYHSTQRHDLRSIDNPTRVDIRVLSLTVFPIFLLDSFFPHALLPDLRSVDPPPISLLADTPSKYKMALHRGFKFPLHLQWELPPLVDMNNGHPTPSSTPPKCKRRFTMKRRGIRAQVCITYSWEYVPCTVTFLVILHTKYGVALEDTFDKENLITYTAHVYIDIIHPITNVEHRNTCSLGQNKEVTKINS